MFHSCRVLFLGEDIFHKKDAPNPRMIRLHTLAVNIIVIRRAPLVGRAGGLSEGPTSEGGKKKRERRREERGKEEERKKREDVLLCLYSLICCF